MYTRIELKNLRGVRKLDIGRLRRINLIVGKNNTGKTTLLEGLFLLGGGTSPVFPTTLGQLRGQRIGYANPDAIWRPLFHGMNPRIPAEVSGYWNGDAAPRRLKVEAMPVTRFSDVLEPSGIGGGVAAATEEFGIGGLQLRYRPASGSEQLTRATFDPKTGNVDAPNAERPDFVRSTFLSARSYSNLVRDARQYSQLVRIKQEQDVLDAVSIIDSRIRRIEILSDAGGPTIYVDVGLDSLIPLAVCGEGFVRFFSIAVELTASRGGVLLIDELDNGLHHGVMPQFWKLLGELCRKHDVQVFATTHNDELLRTAMRAFRELPDTLGLFRLDRRDDGHSAVFYDDDAQQAALEADYEVRG